MNTPVTDDSHTRCFIAAESLTFQCPFLKLGSSVVFHTHIHGHVFRNASLLGTTRKRHSGGSEDLAGLLGHGALAFPSSPCGSRLADREVPTVPTSAGEGTQAPGLFLSQSREERVAATLLSSARSPDGRPGHWRSWGCSTRPRWQVGQDQNWPLGATPGAAGRWQGQAAGAGSSCVLI